MVTQDCTLAKLAILTWRYLYLLKMRIWNSFLNHCQLQLGDQYDMSRWFCQLLYASSISWAVFRPWWISTVSADTSWRAVRWWVSLGSWLDTDATCRELIANTCNMLVVRIEHMGVKKCLFHAWYTYNNAIYIDMWCMNIYLIRFMFMFILCKSCLCLCFPCRVYSHSTLFCCCLQWWYR